MSSNSTLRPSNPDSLKPPYHTPSTPTADDMHSAESSTDGHQTPESVWAGAINARENAITALENDATYLDLKAGAISNYRERNQLFDLSSAITKHADRARQMNGPTFDLVTTGQNIETRDVMNHEDARKLMCALSLALQKTKLDTFTNSASFDQERWESIADSVEDIERATSKILSAHQGLDETGNEQCADPKRTITIGYDEHCDAMSLYHQALIKKMRRQ
jgi:hypothetical protein